MDIYLLYGHLPTGIRKNLWFVASPFYTDCQSLAAQRWQLERALVRHPILDEGTKRTNNQIKKGMISPNFKQKCSFFCPNIYFDQTQAISFRSILIQNFWVVSGIRSLWHYLTNVGSASTSKGNLTWLPHKGMPVLRGHLSNNSGWTMILLVEKNPKQPLEMYGNPVFFSYMGYSKLTP